MSHGITDTDTIWLYRRPAWHGLGTVVQERPASALAWLHDAGLDWAVEKDELITLRGLRDALGQRSGLTAADVVAIAGEHAISDHRATVRSDTRDVLGIVTDDYEPFQNHEAFAFLDALLGETLPETAFSLHGGKQVGALVRLPDHIEVGGDQVRQYIYLRTRHDGGGAVWLFPTAVRVVCANTDRAAVAAAGGSDRPMIHKIRHRGNRSLAVAEARKALQLTLNYSKQFKMMGDHLARQTVTERQLARVVEQLWPTQGDVTLTRRQTTTRRAAQERVRHIFGASDTRGNSPGTRWALYNALTEYDQHERSVRAVDGRVAAERRSIRQLEDPDGFGKLALATVMSV